MLTYEQALARIVRATSSPKSAVVGLDEARGLVLAKPIVARIDLPGFDNSAVDGYAVRVEDAIPTAAVSIRPEALRVIGVAEAGRLFRGTARRGEAVRILTGAAVPRGATAVVMQEQVIRRRGVVVLSRWPNTGANIRRRGEDVRAGRRVLKAGTMLRPQELGLLAALGYETVPVYPRPVVAILTTGDELCRPGCRLKLGQIYDSNSTLLSALVGACGATVLRLGVVRDRMAPLVRALQRSLTADVVIISGGASVGDKDFVRAAAQRCGIRSIFWQVDIKPGKPLFFGKRGRTIVFGLPGNPVSVFVTFQEFVQPALCRLMGRPWQSHYRIPATLAKDLAVSTSRRTQFIRVRTAGRNGQLLAEPLDGQGSHRLLSLVQADGWIRVRADQGPWPAGAPVLVKPAASTVSTETAT